MDGLIEGGGLLAALLVLGALVVFLRRGRRRRTPHELIDLSPGGPDRAPPR